MGNLIGRILGNISTRIMFVIFMIIILMSTFFVVFGYYNQLSLQEERQYDRLSAIVTSIGICMDGDLHEKMFHEQPEKDGIMTMDENAEYKAINKILAAAVIENDLNSPMYTLVYDQEGDVFKYGVRSDDQVYYRHEYTEYPQVLVDNYFEGGTIPKYESENGQWLSAFYPFRNSQGEVVGLIEADVEFTYFDQMVTSQYTRQALIALAVIVAIALILIPYTRTILRKDQEQKELFLIQKRMIEEKNKDITDSINYALKIQTSILPAAESFETNFEDSFVFYRSKDIVAGDFYWMERSGDDIYLACADCTGHGVPGAMVSVVCSNALNRAVNEMHLTDTGEILDAVRDIVVNQFHKGDREMNDGMDLGFAKINLSTMKMMFTGANNPLYKVSNGEFSIIECNKMPVGSYIEPKPFTSTELDLKKGDCYYFFTDGYADQFGGPKGKKFKYKPFQAILLENANKPMKEQMAQLENAFVDWIGDFEQIDDICVIGIRI